MVQFNNSEIFSGRILKSLRRQRSRREKRFSAWVVRVRLSNRVICENGRCEAQNSRFEVLKTSDLGPSRVTRPTSLECQHRFSEACRKTQAGGIEAWSHLPKRRCRVPSILVVDDEYQIRQLIRETLVQAGYQVTEARDGEEALQQYRLAPADLVIMDILMPDQDGLETTATLRREFPNVKVIAVTGGSDMIGILNFLDVAKMLGAHSTLQKPFEMKTLLGMVQAELQD